MATDPGRPARSRRLLALAGWALAPLALLGLTDLAPSPIALAALGLLGAAAAASQLAWWHLRARLGRGTPAALVGLWAALGLLLALVPGTCGPTPDLQGWARCSPTDAAAVAVSAAALPLAVLAVAGLARVWAALARRVTSQLRRFINGRPAGAGDEVGDQASADAAAGSAARPRRADSSTSARRRGRP